MTDQELLAQGYVALPMLPLRGLHVFPGMMLTFDVERPASITALERAVKNNQVIFLTAQKDLTADMPQEDELYRIGTVCRIRRCLSAGASWSRAFFAPLPAVSIPTPRAIPQ